MQILSAASVPYSPTRHAHIHILGRCLSLPHSCIIFLISPSTPSPLSVYCCCCLANISIPGIGVAVPEFRPFFYVNVADISALENELSYVACKWMFETLTFLKSPTEKGPFGLIHIFCRHILRLKWWDPVCVCVLRYYWEDLWGEEGSVWCVCRQSECKDLQRRPETSAPPQHRRQGEISQTHWTEVGSYQGGNQTLRLVLFYIFLIVNHYLYLTFNSLKRIFFAAKIWSWRFPN